MFNFLLILTISIITIISISPTPPSLFFFFSFQPALSIPPLSLSDSPYFVFLRPPSLFLSPSAIGLFLSTYFALVIISCFFFFINFNYFNNFNFSYPTFSIFSFSLSIPLFPYLPSLCLILLILFSFVIPLSLLPHLYISLSLLTYCALL